MPRSTLCDYSDAYILVKENILINNTAAEDATANNRKKKYLKIVLRLLTAQAK